MKPSVRFTFLGITHGQGMALGPISTEQQNSPNEGRRLVAAIWKAFPSRLPRRHDDRLCSLR